MRDARKLLETTRRRLVPATLLFLLLTVPCVSAQAPVVISTSPMPNTHDAALTTDVAVSFNEEISLATVDSWTYVVHAGFSGKAAGTYSLGSIVFDPSADFRPGELVEAIITADVRSTSGDSVTPYVWRFRARTAGGSGQFRDTGQALEAGFGDESEYVDLGDLDGDGDLDAFVVAGFGCGVYRNDGDGVFSPGPLRGNGMVACALGDLNGDGKLDGVGALAGNQGNLCVFQFNGNAIAVYGYGSAYASSRVRRGNGIALGDLNADGFLDVFMVTRHSNPWGDAVCLGNPSCGDLMFGCVFPESGITSYAPGRESRAVALGDLDGDGDLDAFVVGSSPYVWRNAGDGTGTIKWAWAASLDGMDVALGDLDGDTDLDAFIATSNANRVCLNNGDGTFTLSAQYGNADSYGVSLGDLDGDGDLDAFVANQDGPNRVWLNDGNALFAEIIAGYGSGTYAYGNSPSDYAALGDLDGDGDLDAFVANYEKPDRVWLNIDFPYLPYAPPGSGDVNGDGVIDLLDVVLCQQIAAGLVHGTAVQQAAADLDDDGDVDADDVLILSEYVVGIRITLP